MEDYQKTNNKTKMNDTNELLPVIQHSFEPVSLKAITERVDLIHSIQKEVMREGVHYGTVPGVNKPFLWKPGAEVLCMAFQLGVRYKDWEEIELGQGHIRIKVTAEIYHQPTGQVVGEGVGECNTLERKYWIQTVAGEANAEPKFVPADFYNTCKKMAAKRAKIDGAINATNASNVFTQDEDSPGLNKTNASAAGVVPIQGIIQGASSKPETDSKTGKETGRTYFSLEINKRYIWTKEAELGTQLMDWNGIEAIVYGRPSKNKPNVFQAVRAELPARPDEGQEPSEEDLK